MPTNKEKILQFIKEETSRSIQEQTYTFEKCNAQIISMELFLDRANVSRTLNEFYKSGKLIKKTGRPTSYISREILSASFPFASFPDVMDKEKIITDYLSHTNPSKEPSITRSLSIIGASQGGSLYELVNQALPVFYLPADFLKIIVLQGNFGTGKKYFLQKMLKRAKQLHAANSDAKIYFSSFKNLWEHFYETMTDLEKKQSFYIISIDFSNHSFDTKSVHQLLQSMELYYANKTDAPIVAFCIPEDFDSSVFYPVTSIILKFPALRERPQTEIIQIILNLIQQESLRLAKTISVSSQFIQLLASHAENFHQLSQEVLYAVSRGIYDSHKTGELHNICLDPAYLSGRFQKKEQSTDSYSFRHFPDVITLSPETSYDFSKDEAFLTKYHFPLKKTSHISDLLLQDFLLCESAQSVQPTGSYSNDRLNSEIEQLLNKTVFSFDPVLSRHLCSHIVSILNNTLDFHKINLEELKSTSNPDSSALTEKIHQTAIGNHLTFSKGKEAYLSHLLSHCQKMIEDIPVPVIITSRQKQLAQNYSALFNFYYGRRWIHSFPAQKKSSKKNDRSYLDDLYQFALKVNRGQGILILSDENMKSTISNHFYQKTKLMIYCIPLHSFLILEDAARLLLSEDRNLFSIIPNLLICQQNELSALKGNYLNRTTLRAADPHLLFAAKLTPGLSPVTTNEYFFLALKNILKCLDIEITNNRIYGFLFHANSLLFQKIHHLSFYKEPLTSEHSNMDSKLLALIKESVLNVPELRKYNFEEQDFEILYQALVFSGI